MEKFEQDSPKQTLVTRGKAFYVKHLKTLLEPQHEGEFLAIEPESGHYFLGRTSVAALDAARAAVENYRVTAKLPKTQIVALILR